jgi:hypothetical protein
MVSGMMDAQAAQHRRREPLELKHRFSQCLPSSLRRLSFSEKHQIGFKKIKKNILPKRPLSALNCRRPNTALA